MSDIKLGMDTLDEQNSEKLRVYESVVNSQKRTVSYPLLFCHWCYYKDRKTSWKK